MDEAKKKGLQKRDTVDILCLKIRWAARHLEYGVLELHGTHQNQIPVLQVVNGKVKQCDIEIRPIERIRGNGTSRSEE